jgi:hypothetical protein
MTHKLLFSLTLYASRKHLISSANLLHWSSRESYARARSVWIPYDDDDDDNFSLTLSLTHTHNGGARIQIVTRKYITRSLFTQ